MVTQVPVFDRVQKEKEEKGRYSELSVGKIIEE